MSFLYPSHFFIRHKTNESEPSKGPLLNPQRKSFTDSFERGKFRECIPCMSECLVTKSCLTLITPWTVAHQAPLSMGFSRHLCTGDFPGTNIGIVCHFLLQEIFPTQGLNPSLLHCRQILYHLSYQGSSVYPLGLN